jgi:hypothetical protein
MKQNRIVPDSLADLLVTFTLSGYYDATLRDAVNQAPRRPFAKTSWLSGHQTFPDAYYELHQTGRMEWLVTPDMLALDGRVGALRNVGVLGIPSQRRPELGRLVCSYPLEFDIDAAGSVTFLQQLPPLALSINGLDLDASFDSPAGATLTLDFGDGTGLADATALPHRYTRPGTYELLIRIALQGRLTEYRAAVVVSEQHGVAPPIVARPQLSAAGEAGGIRVVPSLSVPSGESLGVSWRIDRQPPDPGTEPASFLIQPGRHRVEFTATRPLLARFYGRQRYGPDTQVQLDRLHIVSNRTFDVDTGAETTVGLNAFGQQILGGDTVSPVDRWTLELPLDDNPSLVSVTGADIRRHNLGELSDMVLTLEYADSE